MTVEEAITKSNHNPITNGMVGNELPDWCKVGTINVRSGQLTAIDFGVISATDGITVDVWPGSYRVQTKIMSFGGNLGICRVRAVAESADAIHSGPTIGNVSVDFAKIAIGDIADAAEGLTRDDRKAIGKAVRPFRKTFGAIARLELPSKTIELACVMSGFGDGRYPVNSLASDGRVIGMEIEFVKDGYVYNRARAPLPKEDLKAMLEKLATLKPPPRE